ncbi:hypothetical protein J3F84DRAFT_101483 [Trichoderma pleuroticola]
MLGVTCISRHSIVRNWSVGMCNSANKSCEVKAPFPWFFFPLSFFLFEGGARVCECVSVRVPERGRERGGRQRRERLCARERECVCVLCAVSWSVHKKKRKRAHLLLPALARITGTRSPLPLVVRNSGSGHEGREECCASDRWMPFFLRNRVSFFSCNSYQRRRHQLPWSNSQSLHDSSSTVIVCTYKLWFFANPRVS